LYCFDARRKASEVVLRKAPEMLVTKLILNLLMLSPHKFHTKNPGEEKRMKRQ